MSAFPLKVTERAAQQLHFLMASHPAAPQGIRINLKTRGCSGLMYKLEYVEAPYAGDDSCWVQGIHVYVAPQASLFLVGTTMDYEETPLSSGFVFQNPNEKGRCGCGDSFYI